MYAFRPCVLASRHCPMAPCTFSHFTFPTTCARVQRPRNVSCGLPLFLLTFSSLDRADGGPGAIVCTYVHDPKKKMPLEARTTPFFPLARPFAHCLPPVMWPPCWHAPTTIDQFFSNKPRSTIQSFLQFRVNWSSHRLRRQTFFVARPSCETLFMRWHGCAVQYVHMHTSA